MSAALLTGVDELRRCGMGLSHSHSRGMSFIYPSSMAIENGPDGAWYRRRVEFPAAFSCKRLKSYDSDIRHSRWGKNGERIARYVEVEVVDHVIRGSWTHNPVGDGRKILEIWRVVGMYYDDNHGAEHQLLLKKICAINLDLPDGARVSSIPELERKAVSKEVVADILKEVYDYLEMDKLPTTVPYLMA